MERRGEKNRRHHARTHRILTSLAEDTMMRPSRTVQRMGAMHGEAEGQPINGEASGGCAS
jgi:hypothetical protein